MKKIIIALIFVFVMSSMVFAEQLPMQPSSGGPSGGQLPPSGSQSGNMQPPSEPGQSSGTMKERLEMFYTAKEQYIEAKRQCKERAVKEDLEQGTCWEELKPMAVKILMNELALTHDRLVQLKEQNITFENAEEFNAKLAAAKTVLEDESADKTSIKNTAKELEEIITEIEDEATKKQPEVLLKQLDSIIESANKVTTRLQTMLSEFKSKGIDTEELESDLEQFKEDVKDAKETVSKAKSRYESSKSSEELSSTVTELRSMINEAKSTLEKAFDTVKAMISNMNQQQEGQDDNSGEGDLE